MLKRLTPHGNSLALVIEKPVLKLLNITAETSLDITTDGRSIIVSPAGRSPRSKVNGSKSAAQK
ncbi:MAG: AbrB/MazE/SpoVT family DNA-binding domain-containing protein [Candidatus Omnitrophica bacterium]|nr:AbrB/MazE/SpoVT family DNA-binding domain-containing protein [Candidatus Omnitrophota bacterium]